MAKLVLLLLCFMRLGCATADEDSCKVLGCGTYKKGNTCQCNSRCAKYGDCCTDYKATCGAGPTPGPSPHPHPHPSPRPHDSCDVNRGPSGGPEQLHLALGEVPEKMTVTFATSKKYMAFKHAPMCIVEGLGNFTGTTRTYSEGNWSGLLHTVTLEGLHAATSYTYNCGSGSRSFRTAPAVGTLPVTIAAVADLGENCDRGGCPNATISRLNSAAAAGDYSLFLHAGDIAYTKGDTCIWDNFFRELEPAASTVPYMVAVGNHEHYYNFSAYRTRFSMPGAIAQASQNLWYSFDYGGVHVTVFSTEHDLDLQMAWMRADLQNAAKNRDLVPWIVVMAHKPMYCSTDDYFDCEYNSHKIADMVEPLFKESAVDLFLGGHLHNYERSWPVFNGTVSAKSYSNPTATVHAVIGMAGDIEGLTDRWLQPPDWRATKDARLGYASINFVNASYMKFDYILSETGAVADSFVLNKGTEILVV